MPTAPQGRVRARHLAPGQGRTKVAGACVRLELGHKSNRWLTLTEAQVLLAELTAAVRAAEREQVAARHPPPEPEPPLASAAALPAA